jgi:hypothetical protein
MGDGYKVKHSDPVPPFSSSFYPSQQSNNPDCSIFEKRVVKDNSYFRLRNSGATFFLFTLTVLYGSITIAFLPFYLLIFCFSFSFFITCVVSKKKRERS